MTDDEFVRMAQTTQARRIDPAGPFTLGLCVFLLLLLAAVVLAAFVPGAGEWAAYLFVAGVLSFFAGGLFTLVL